MKAFVKKAHQQPEAASFFTLPEKFIVRQIKLTVPLSFTKKNYNQKKDKHPAGIFPGITQINPEENHDTL
jgi:hypothetical protein